MGIGSKVKVKKWISRISKIESITINSLGTTIYILQDGGRFSISEIELIK